MIEIGDRGRGLGLALCLLGFLSVGVGTGRAQGSCVLLSGGCSPPVQNNQCFPDALGPVFWEDVGGGSVQTRRATESDLSTCHGPVGVGAPPRCCTSFHPPASGPAPTVTLRVVGRRVLVDYEAPNYYCQQTGDWPPTFTCFNDPIVSSDQLLLLDDRGDVLARTFIYYEKGTWDTGVDLPCGGPRTIEARIRYLGEPGIALLSGTDRQELEGDCGDRRACPLGISAGAPVNVGSGDVAVEVPLFTLRQEPLSLSFDLTYHSGLLRYPGLVELPLGPGWTYPFAQTLRPTDASRRVLYHLTAEGFESEYTQRGDGVWVASSPGELQGRVEEVGDEVRLIDLDGTTTAFDVASGRWLRTTDRWGNSLTGTYSGDELVAVSDAVGREIQLLYTAGELSEIVLPGGASWRFAYDGGLLTEIFDPLHPGAVPWRSFRYTLDRHGVARLLTEVRDASGALLEGHGYDARDRGASSFSEGGRDHVSLAYNTPSPGRTTVVHQIDATSQQTAVIDLEYQKGRWLPTHVEGMCATCGLGMAERWSFTYTSDNHLASRTDGKGVVTRFDYNDDGNVIARTEAAGTPQERTTRFAYDDPSWPNFRTEIDAPSAARPGARAVTTMGWDSPAETLLTRVETGFTSADATNPLAITSTTLFDSRHRLVETDGPRTDLADVTRRSYFPDDDPDPLLRGRLQEVTDAAGLTTRLDAYDLFGTPLHLTDPNGVETEQVTDARGRLVRSIDRRVAGNAAESVDYETRHVYDDRDRLVEIVLPRGNGFAYGYEDGTNRLVDEVRLDAGGDQRERRHSTLDLLGAAVRVEDQSCRSPAPSCTTWVTKREERYVYDADHRLVATVHPVPEGAAVFNTYDANGLLASVQDERHSAPNTEYAYDALDRVTAVQQALASAPGGTITTSYAYDAQDHLTSVTDPNGNTTTYLFDDFGRLVRQESPVSGETTYTYDPAGNLLVTAEANGAVTTRTFDAANRLVTSTSTQDGKSSESILQTYDDPTTGAFGLGRLTGLSDPSGTSRYSYDRRGLLRSEERSIQSNRYTVAYAYDANGNRVQLAYPSGREVTYGFDFADRPISAASGATTYVASASYLPFGPETELVYGNGTRKETTYDTRYRTVRNRLLGDAGALADYAYEEDGAGNITSIHDVLDPGYDRDFGYDDLDRLVRADTGSKLWGRGSYRYDPMGNLLSLELGSARQSSFAYRGTLPLLASVTENGLPRSVGYDPAGNQIEDGGSTLDYSPRNRLAAADGLAYTYDGQGLRTVTEVTRSLGTLTGLVLEATTGVPVPGATVRVAGTSNSTATDARGRFTLAQGEGTWVLAVTAPGFLPAASAPFLLGPGASFDVGTIRLEIAPGKITGTVVGSDGGRLLSGALVTLEGSDDFGLADPQGTFSLVEPPGRYTVTFDQAGYEPQTLPPVDLAAGAVVDVGTVTLQVHPATISGTVVDAADGGPLSGVTVVASPELVGTGGAIARARRSVAGLSAAVAQGVVSATSDASGSFSLTLPPDTYTLTYSKAGFGERSTSGIAVGAGASYAAGSIPLERLASVSGQVVRSTDGTPVAGATITVTGTLDVVSTEADGRFTISLPAGSPSLTITAVGFADLTTQPLPLAPGDSLDVGVLRLSPVALSVSVAYADNLRASTAFPVPWQGSPNVVFLGGGDVYDAGAVRLDNSTESPIDVDRVTVDLERPGPLFDLWGSFTVPAGGSVILTQTRRFDFDTSDAPILACDGLLAPGDPRVPKVTVTVDGVSTDYFDTGHILDAGGVDLAACGKNESLPWRLIGTTGVAAQGDFLLGPPSGRATLGSPYVLEARLTDANGGPLPGVAVGFLAVDGPNRGRAATATTDGAGRADFSYQSAFSGTDVWQATVDNASGGSLTSNTATVAWPSLPGIELFVGYADSVRPDPAFPNPWQGSPGIVYLGGSGQIDAGAVRLDNTTDEPISVDRVTVDLQRPGPLFDLWGSFTLPPHGAAILTQTRQFDFDTSEFAIVGCGQPLAPGDPRIPKITVTSGGFTSSYLDTSHILDTFGFDLACLRNESLQWRPVGEGGAASQGALALAPVTSSRPVGSEHTLLAVVTDAAGEPLPNLTVAFRVLSGPQAGTLGQASTDAAGTASFSYTGQAAGTDTGRASITNASGGRLDSNSASVRWVPSVSLTLAPPSRVQAVGTPYNATLTATDGAGLPVPDLTVRFIVRSGPDAGLSGSGTTDATGQAVFSFTSTAAGVDRLDGEVTGAAGGTVTSNPVSVEWTATESVTLAPPVATRFLGAEYTATATVTDGSAPVAGIAVHFEVLRGPNVGVVADATTDSAGRATISYTSSALGMDLLEAFLSAGSGASGRSSNPVSVTWQLIPTRVTYTGPASGEHSDPLTLTARLTEATSGLGLGGQALTFVLGDATATGTTDGSGVATVVLTPRGAPA